MIDLRFFGLIGWTWPDPYEPRTARVSELMSEWLLRYLIDFLKPCMFSRTCHFTLRLF